MKKRKFPLIFILVIGSIILASCQAPVQEAAPQPENGKIKVFAAFATPIEEPWDGVIHRALEKAAEEGKIEYLHTDDIGYSGDMERVLREICEDEKPDLIVGDGFGNEEAIRRVAADYKEIAFAFGSGLGPVEPNFQYLTIGFMNPVIYWVCTQVDYQHPIKLVSLDHFLFLRLPVLLMRSWKAQNRLIRMQPL